MSTPQGQSDQTSQKEGAQVSHVSRDGAQGELSAINQHVDSRAVETQAENNPRNPNGERAGIIAEQEAPGMSTSMPDKRGTDHRTEETPVFRPVQHKSQSSDLGSNSPLDNPDRTSNGLALQDRDDLTYSTLALRFFKASDLLFLTLIIYGLTIYCAITATDRYSPLGVVPPNQGILILNILSKAGDLALAAAAGKLWCIVQWKLISRPSNTSLATVFSLGSWTDVSGLLRIACGPKESGKDSPRLWAIARLLAICCLPGPGIIIMSDINTENLNHPVEWTSISGGMGSFDRGLVDTFKQGSGPYISGLIQTILRDPAISFLTAPISASCSNSSLSCTSFILSGGVESVSPWPFNITMTDESNYIIQNGPAYQIDFGNVLGGVSWSDDSCYLYGSEEAALQLCIQNATDVEETGQLISGWRICPTNITAAGECNQTGSWNASEMWTTSMAVYRRSVTVSASRINWAILDAQDLGNPTLETINPSDLFAAFDGILTFLQNASNPDPSSTDTPEYQLTKYLYTYLNQSATLANQVSSVPLDYLRNLLVTPLYLCNPVMLSAADSPTTIQPGLPQENYLRGSYAIPATRAVPARWTVWTYAALGGAILLVMGVVLAWASLSEQPESSSFPVADLFISATINETTIQADQEREGQTSEISWHDIFKDVEPGENSEILNQAKKITVSLRARETKIHKAT